MPFSAASARKFVACCCRCRRAVEQPLLMAGVSGVGDLARRLLFVITAGILLFPAPGS
jgi:hypothetical protein